MKYKKIIKGTFIDRPNRFIAHVNINNNIEVVHVKNTGKCKEILTKNATVFLSDENNPKRKTKYDLVSVIKERPCNDNLLINIDSQIVNDVAEEWITNGPLFPANVKIKREVKFGDSRFDFYIETGEEKVFLEAKGVTLENEGIASFPDAPTLRGIKHINELCKCKNEGYRAIILFVIQMKGISKFVPNKIIHKDFADALKNAVSKGVEVYCIDCFVTENSITYDTFIPYEL